MSLQEGGVVRHDQNRYRKAAVMINGWKKFDGGWSGRSADTIVVRNVENVVDSGICALKRI